MPTVLGGIFITAILGTWIQRDACNFVKSAACVVRYLPDDFTCDYAHESYIPKPGISVHYAETKTDTSVKGNMETHPGLWFTHFSVHGFGYFRTDVTTFMVFAFGSRHLEKKHY